MKKVFNKRNKLILKPVKFREISVTPDTIMYEINHCNVIIESVVNLVRGRSRAASRASPRDNRATSCV